MLKVIKKDNTTEAFDVQKVVVAVNKSAFRALIKFTEEEIEEKLKSDKFKQSYATVLQAKRFNYDNDNNPIQNHVIALSSVEFIIGEYSESSATSNTSIAFKVAERAVGVEESSIMFDTKTIEVESYAVDVTEESVNAMRIIFMFGLPIIMVALGVIVFIRRKNS